MHNLIIMSSLNSLEVYLNHKYGESLSTREDICYCCQLLTFLIVLRALPYKGILVTLYHQLHQCSWPWDDWFECGQFCNLSQSC
jgi:hypothetical protein